MAINDIFEKQSKWDNDTKKRLSYEDLRDEYADNIERNFNEKKSNPVSNQVDLTKFNEKSLEFVYGNYSSPKEALYQRRYELPLETLAMIVGDRKKNMAHKLLEWQKRGLYEEKYTEPDAADIISRFTDQFVYRAEHAQNPAVRAKMGIGMEELVREAISLKVLTAQQLEYAINKGAISYDQLKQFAKEGILREEQLNANIKVEYTTFDGTSKQMEGKLYQHLMREENLMVKDKRTFTKWMDKKHHEISSTAKDLRGDFVQYSINLEAQGIDTQDNILLDEIIKYTTPENQEKVGEALKNRIERSNDLDKTFDMMSDLIKFHHKSTGDKANAIASIFEKCQEAIYKGGIKSPEMVNAQATFKRAAQYCDKHPNVMRFAMKQSPGTRGALSAPGDDTFTQSKVMLAALSMPCAELSKNFDQLKFMAPSQQQFENRSILQVGWGNICRGLSGIKASARVEHFNEFMKAGQQDIQEAVQKAEAEVGVTKVEGITKPTSPPPPVPTSPPPVPSHKPPEPKVTLQDGSKIPAPPSHEPPVPSMKAVVESIKTINKATHEKVQVQSKELDAKNAVKDQGLEQDKGGMER